MLIKTMSCDAGVRVDLLCDSCDVLFSPGAGTPPIRSAIWAAASACGWTSTGSSLMGRHFCPACAEPREDQRLATVGPSGT
ncbi:hypothetical protein HC031_18670 [Planosporangium thailandense]|uniref:Uncharacterized protein n=1 Tax=Planosporangium thailandense TaxID=765197 RepID=A0ABX0Y2R9_9ACTN|nr:hypothetical protein [Planosporangium thailandense]NJC71727.1 hypothetical protein [Planosporangium thailandense]